MQRQLSLSFFLMGFFLLKLTSADQLYPNDMLKIKERDTLIVAQFGGERPGFFAYDDENKLPERIHLKYNDRLIVGYDIEIAQKVANELGVHLRLDRNYSSFNDVAQSVAEGKADMAISKLSVTTKRAQFLNYTDPYISLRMALMVNRMEESRIGTRKDEPLFAVKQKGVKIGVLGKSAFEAHGKKMFPNAELVLYEDQETLFNAALRGDVVAVFYEEYEIGKYMRKRPDMAIYCYTAYMPGRKDDIAIAVAGNSITLHGFLQTFMQKEQISTTVQELITNFIPEEELQEVKRKKRNPFTSITLYVALIAVVIFFMIWLSFAKGKNNHTDREGIHE